MQILKCARGTAAFQLGIFVGLLMLGNLFSFGYGGIPNMQKKFVTSLRNLYVTRQSRACHVEVRFAS